MLTFTAGERSYRMRKLTVFEQWDVVSPLGPVLMATASVEGQSKEIKAQAFLEALSSIPSEKAHKIITTCLKTVERQQQDGLWLKIWDTASGNPMQEDLQSLPACIAVVAQVIKEHVGNFTEGLATNL